MNKTSKLGLCLSLALLLSSTAFADDIVMNTAHLQAMDKITGRVSELNIPVNGLANFGTFSILVRKCVTKSPEETPENTAFVDVVDNYQSETPVNIFKGWMFSSTPGINGIEHPIYDIWLLKCYNSDKSKHKVLTEEQLKFRDELPMVHHKKQKQNFKLSAVDEIVDDENTKIVENQQTNDENDEVQKNSQPEQMANMDIVKIDVDTIVAETTQHNDAVEEEFVAEGEEITGETIIVNNETVAKDEEQQMAKDEQTLENTSEDVVIDEINE